MAPDSVYAELFLAWHTIAIAVYFHVRAIFQVKLRFFAGNHLTASGFPIATESRKYLFNLLRGSLDRPCLNGPGALGGRAFFESEKGRYRDEDYRNQFIHSSGNLGLSDDCTVHPNMDATIRNPRSGNHPIVSRLVRSRELKGMVLNIPGFAWPGSIARLGFRWNADKRRAFSQKVERADGVVRPLWIPAALGRGVSGASGRNTAGRNPDCLGCWAWTGFRIHCPLSSPEKNQLIPVILGKLFGKHGFLGNMGVTGGKDHSVVWLFPVRAGRVSPGVAGSFAAYRQDYGRFRLFGGQMAELEDRTYPPTLAVEIPFRREWHTHACIRTLCKKPAGTCRVHPYASYF